jgi:glycosyltransferase involved in cell wall biosynthesis
MKTEFPLPLRPSSAILSALKQPLTVAWISDFPLEWLADLPEPLRALPRRHPATWEMVLLEEFEKNPTLRIHVVALRHRIERDFSFERNGATYHILKAPVWLRLGSLFWLDTLLIRRLCRRIQPDLIHAWGMEKGAAMIANRLSHPYVMTVQGLYGWYRQRVPMDRYDSFIERLERIYLPRSPVVTTESKFAVQWLKERYPRLRIQQAEHAPNWAFHRVQRSPQTKPIHFISVGTLGFRKGTDLLFKALDSLCPSLSFKLTMVTNPNQQYLDNVRKTVSNALWERVQFRHHILPNEVARELETPAMLLLPTRADTSPNAVKEAAVAGVPVVASDVGGIPDYIIPEKNGYLFPPTDLGGFIRNIEKACAHPLFSRGLVEPETLTNTRAYLSPKRMAENFLKAYEMAFPNR